MHPSTILDPEILISLPEHRVFFQTDAEGVLVCWNPLFAQFLGIPEQKLTRCLFADLVEEEEQEKTRLLLQSALQGQPETGYAAFQTPAGRKLAQLTVVPMMQDGRPSGCFGFIHDATSRVEKTRRLFESEQKFQALLHNKSACVKIIDQYGRLLEINKSGVEYLEAGSDEELLGKDILWHIHPEDRLAFLDHHRKVLSGYSCALEFRIRGLRGTERWMSSSMVPLQDREGTIYASLSVTQDITGRRAEQALLRISNERYQFVSQATSDVLWDWNLETNEIYINKAFTRVLGHEPGEDSPGAIWLRYLHPEDRARVVSRQNAAIVDPSVEYWHDQYRFLKPDGNTVYLEDRAVIMRDESGRAVRMVGAVHDVTPQKEIQLRLQGEKRRFRAMVQSGLDVVVLLDQHFVIRYVSPNAFAISGYEPDDVMGVLGFDAIHPDDFVRVLTEGQSIMRQSQVMLSPFRYRIKNGSYRWLEAVLSNYLEDADINSIVINLRDITERKHTEDELRRLSLVAENTTNCVIITNAAQQITWINKAFTNCYGYTLEEAQGKTPGELLTGPETDSLTLRRNEKELALGGPARFEIFNYAKDGSGHWMDVQIQPIVDDAGRLVQYFALHNNITGRKQIEEAVRLSEEKYKLLFYQSPVPKWIVSKEDGRFVEVNDAAIGLYGYSREEFLSMTFEDIRTAGKDAQAVRINDLLSGAVQQTTTRHYTLSGEEICVELTAHGIYLDSGYHVMIIASDITEKLTLEQQVLAEQIRVQKEIAKAILNTQEKERSEIGKELHDNVNQLLTTTKLYIENIRYYPAQAETYVEKSAVLLQRAITEIRNLSKALVTPVIYDIGFRATLEELMDQYRALRLFELTFEFTVAEERIEKGLRLTIYRLLQEQLNNIAKHSRASTVLVQVQEMEGLLNICVTDDGIGFDPHAKKAGLGLSNMKNRIGVFQGDMHLITAENKGCALCIYFPF